MAELKPYEEIIRFSPVAYSTKDGDKVRLHTEYVSQLTRCCDCKWSREPNRTIREENEAVEGVLVCVDGCDLVYGGDSRKFVNRDWFCADGKQEG